MESSLLAVLFIVVLLLIGIVVRLAIKVGKTEAGFAGLDAKLETIKTNDLAHVMQEIQGLRQEVHGLRNTIFSQMQEMMLEIVGKIVGQTCGVPTCPFVKKDK